MNEEIHCPDYVAEETAYVHETAELADEVEPFTPPLLSPPPLPVPSRKPFPGILQSFGLAILFIVLQFVIGIALAIGLLVSGMIDIDRLASPEALFEVISPWVIVIPMIVVEVGVIMLGIWLARRPVSETLGLRSAPVQVYIAIAPVTLGLIILFSELDNLIRAYLPFLTGDITELLVLMQDVFIGVVFISLLGPLLEEFLFRGVILSGLLKRYKAPTAYIVSAFLFSVVHMSVAQIPTAFLIGLLLAWLYHKTGSIWPCFFVHALNNFLLFLNIRFPISFTIEGFNAIPQEGVKVFQPWWFDATGVFLLGLGIVLLKRLLPRREAVPVAVQEKYVE